MLPGLAIKMHFLVEYGDSTETFYTNRREECAVRSGLGVAWLSRFLSILDRSELSNPIMELLFPRDVLNALWFSHWMLA